MVSQPPVVAQRPLPQIHDLSQDFVEHGHLFLGEGCPIWIKGALLATAGSWSLPATQGLPAHVTGIMMGGLDRGEVERGTTITVFLRSLRIFTEITTQGLVLRISAGGLHLDPLGARTVGSATEPAPVVQGHGRWR